ncbi:MAG: UvrD-helicase domain-containing protein [Clostridiales bacterium]|nr:UvrD-helicase domain-containing protein [Clostridiales bacterium]
MGALDRFTVNQRAAVTTQGNIIVSAGAGSGKTTVMIARIIEKLKAGARLDDMLIVTFTRASAADMRIKLTEKLLELKNDKSGGEDFRDTANAALEKLPTCNIGTLHSYCQKLVRMYFYAAGLEPSAELCDEGEASVMKARAVSDAVERALKKRDEHFMVMYDMLSSRNDDETVKKVIGNILEFALTMPDPDLYLSTVRPDCESAALLEDKVNVRKNTLLADLNEIIPELERAGMGGAPKKGKKTKTHVETVKDLIALLNGEINKIENAARSYDGCDLALHDSYAELKEECTAFCAFKAEVETAASLNSEPYVRALMAVAADARNAYAERKKLFGKMDFSDLEHGAYNVLRDEASIAEIAKSVKYVFIDEFQDVNPLQSAIAERFRNAGAEMFVVGDVKQSIYGFRRCSPKHFKTAIKNANALGDPIADDKAYTHIPLTDNFRSSEAVIDFVNKVFDGVMTEDFGEVDYSDPAQRLKWGNKDMMGGKAAFYVVGDEAVTPETDTVVEPTEAERKPFAGYSIATSADKASAEHNEAVLVADYIAQYVKSAGPQAGSIAVLVSAIKNNKFVAALTAELDTRGIGYAIGSDREANTFPEIVALMDLLRCADNRLDDIALYTALRSSVGGFSDEELAAIAERGKCVCDCTGVTPIIGGDRPRYALWQKIVAYDGALKDRIAAFISARDRIAEYAYTHDCADVLGFITSEFDYFQHVYETGGSAAAVDALIRFAADRGLDMHAFIEYYDDSEIKLPANGGGDGVTITTIHKSKGLEYDCAIVADTARKFNELDQSQRVLISDDGVFVKLPIDDSGKLAPSAPWKVENMQCKSRERAEELRLLYVALTRAKKRLVVTGEAKWFKTKVAPCDANRMIKFMKNAPTSDIDVPRYSDSGRSDVEYPFDANIAKAVSERHKLVERRNAQRTESVLTIKTCVTSVAHREWDEEDYTSFAPVLTVDDRDDRDDEGGVFAIGGNNKRAGGADGMLRGTAYHRAMELADFNDLDMAELRRTCENFNLITDEREIERAVEVMRGLTANCAFVAKERYFIVNLPASEVYGEDIIGSVLVQGVIDLLIVDEAGNATIVDYKTGNPASLINAAYRKQLELYKAAVERTTPYKVKRAVLYSFASGKIIEP